MCISSKVGGKCSIMSVEADLFVRVVGIPANVTGSWTKVEAGGKLMCVEEPDLSLMSVCAFSSTSSELFNISCMHLFNTSRTGRKLLLKSEDVLFFPVFVPFIYLVLPFLIC